MLNFVRTIVGCPGTDPTWQPEPRSRRVHGLCAGHAAARPHLFYSAWPGRMQCRRHGFQCVLCVFVPVPRRRQLMNFVLVTTAGIPVLVALGCYLWYFVPPVASGGGGAQLCGDLDGNPVTLESWVKGHKDNDRELVQGLKGEPYYLISTPDNIKDFALLSVCTHLGCVVPWSKAANKFCCPCHGSQYDENGKVVRGPAPLSLALAHTTTVKGNLALSPWTEQDFRTNVDPWWK